MGLRGSRLSACQCFQHSHSHTYTHTPPPPPSEHFSSVFSQWCRIKLCPQRRQHRDGLSFLGFLGPTSKTQRLKLGISEQLESLFNYICGRQECHQCVTPCSNPTVLSSQGKSGGGLSQMRLCWCF